MTSSTFTLKIELDGEVRRARMSPEDASDSTFASLRATVVSLFEISPASALQLSWKYMDDEGDLCTLADTTFTDALRLAAESKVLRLYIARKTPTSDGVADTSSIALGSCVFVPDCRQSDVSPALVSADAPQAELPDEENTAGEQEPCDGLTRHVSGSFTTTRSMIVEECKRLLQHVKSDFNAAKSDMSGAFQPRPDELFDHESTTCAAVAGAVGAVVAVRKVPIHLVTLAASSVTAVVGTPEATPEAAMTNILPSNGDGAPSHASALEGQGALRDSSQIGSMENTEDSHAAEEEQTPSVATAADDVQRLLTQTKQTFSEFHDEMLHSIERVQAPAGATDEVSHFVGQVKQDFRFTHDEMQGAINELVCACKALCGKPPTRGQCVFSSICASVAGATVAGTLTPLRGARLAVAKWAAPCTPVPPTSEHIPDADLDEEGRHVGILSEVSVESEAADADDEFSGVGRAC